MARRAQGSASVNMTIKIKNKFFAEGGKQYLDLLTSKEFPEGLGDLSWEFAMLSVDIDNIYKAYAKERKLFTKAYETYAKKLIEELGEEDKINGQGKVIRPDNPNHAKFMNDEERLKLEEDVKAKMEALSDREFTLEAKIIVKLEDLKKLGVSPATLKVLSVLLDVRK